MTTAIGNHAQRRDPRAAVRVLALAEPPSCQQRDGERRNRAVREQQLGVRTRGTGVDQRQS